MPNPNSGDKRDRIAHEILGPTPDSKSKVKILEALLAAGAAALPREERLIVGAVVHMAVPAILRILLAHGQEPNERGDRVPGRYASKPAMPSRVEPHVVWRCNQRNASNAVCRRRSRGTRVLYR
jgi:hypothetical protein